MRTRHMRWTCAVAAILALAVMAFPASAEDSSISEETVAIVNGTTISAADLEKEVGRFRWQYSTMGKSIADTEMGEIRKEALETLIEAELLYQDSKNQNINVGGEEIDQHLATLKQRYPSEDAFRDALTKMNLSEETIRSQFERGKVVQQLIEEHIAKNITISDEESKSYYEDNPDLFKQPEQVGASHILIKVEPNADESQKAKAREELEGIRRKLDEGQDFSALAKEFSHCPSSAKGGDLGYFGRGQMVKPFEDTAFSLPPDEVSDIVETDFGYHLIKITEKKPEQLIPYEDIKGRLEQYLEQLKMQKEVELYIEKLKEEADVKRFPVD